MHRGFTSISMILVPATINLVLGKLIVKLHSAVTCCNSMVALVMSSIVLEVITKSSADMAMGQAWYMSILVLTEGQLKWNIFISLFSHAMCTKLFKIQLCFINELLHHFFKCQPQILRHSLVLLPLLIIQGMQLFIAFYKYSGMFNLGKYLP